MDSFVIGVSPPLAASPAASATPKRPVSPIAIDLGAQTPTADGSSERKRPRGAVPPVLPTAATPSVEREAATATATAEGSAWVFKSEAGDWREWNAKCAVRGRLPLLEWNGSRSARAWAA